MRVLVIVFLVIAAVVWGLVKHPAYLSNAVKETMYAASIVNIVNETSSSLSGLQITDGQVYVDVPAIPPGGESSQSITVQQDGALKLRGTYEGQIVEAVIDPYVTRSVPTRKVVHIQADGTFKVDA